MKKKQLIPLLMVIGYIIALVGGLLTALNIGYDISSLLATSLITMLLPATFSICFVFANNNTLKNFGYAFGALCGIDGLYSITIADESFYVMTMAIGEIVLMVGACLYLILIILKYFGFVKSTELSSANTDALDAIIGYNDLLKDNVITQEEFSTFKNNLLMQFSSEKSSANDLKKWKNALDKKLITQSDYEKIKSHILNNN